MAAGITGKNAYIAFGGTALNTNYRTFSAENSIETVDQSAGADAGMTRLTTLLDSSFSIEIKRPAGGTTNWISLTPGVSGSIELGPEGTATGKPKLSVTVLLTGVSTEVAYNDLVLDTYEFEQNDSTGVVYTSY